MFVCSMLFYSFFFKLLLGGGGLWEWWGWLHVSVDLGLIGNNSILLKFNLQNISLSNEMLILTFGQ